ncbi:replication initiation protein [Moraxella equi]|nr:replication initiation protein [Moraxella equi]STZ82967.1 Protein involved in initiation of plasmid replication [Moraxella equi]STZ82976.1 Protein involved in initiation of plasmid replication [Moraxella equi]STZ82992.1 Protein involved in initiation of plasmid replication [Moraxella equi]
MENKAVQRVKTPQELIHIKHAISERQYKYWFILIKVFQEFLLNDIKPNEKGFYSVPVAEINKMMGYEVKKQHLKDDLTALTTTGIAFNYLEKNGKEVFYGASFLSEFKLYSKTLKFRLPSFIQDVLEGNEDIKKMFLVMDWNIFNSFNGKYEAIIYKLCKDYIGFGKTKYFTIEAYRDYIGLKDDEYNEFKALNRWTISKPIENINNNELSDIIVRVEFKKQGRKVIGLHFQMEYKRDIPFEKLTPETNPVFEKSLITITPIKQQEYLQKYSEDQIKAIVDYVNAQNEQGKIKNLGAYYHKAFLNGWGLENFEAEQKAKAEEEERKRQAKAKREAELKAQREAEEKIRKEEEFKNYCIDLFFKLSKEEQKEILDEAEKRLLEQKQNIVLGSFKTKREKDIENIWTFSFNYIQLKAILKEKNMI